MNSTTHLEGLLKQNQVDWTHMAPERTPEIATCKSQCTNICALPHPCWEVTRGSTGDVYSDEFCDAIYGTFKTHIRLFLWELALSFMGPQTETACMVCPSHHWCYQQAWNLAEVKGARPFKRCKAQCGCTDLGPSRSMEWICLTSLIPSTHKSILNQAQMSSENIGGQ